MVFDFIQNGTRQLITVAIAAEENELRAKYDA